MKMLATKTPLVIASETQHSHNTTPTAFKQINNIINATKLETQLGWKADENFDSGIVKSVEWYLGKYE
jgi:dTDP-D-glucose 4,6-dehydratase